MTFLQMIILLMEVILKSIKTALSFKDVFEIHIVSVLNVMVDLLESVSLGECLCLRFISL